MKKIILILTLIVLTLGSLFSAESLLSVATNGLFLSLNDYTSKPNSHFNNVGNDAFIFSSSFNSSGISTSSSGGAELGYYHYSKIPFAATLSFFLSSDKHIAEQITETETRITSVKYTSPLSNSFDFSLKGIVGLPFFLDSSGGVSLHMFGNGNNKFTSTTTITDKDGNKIGDDVTSVNKNSLLKTEISIPLYLRINEKFSNYLNFTMYFSSYDTERSNVGGDIEKNHYGTFSLYFHDKFTLFSLIPGGKETNIFLSLGNNPTFISEDEKSPFEKDEDYIFSSQFGLNNTIDLKPIENITLSLNPKFYIDLEIGTSSSFALGFTLSSDVALYASFGNFSFFFGFTPRLSYYFKKDVVVHESATTSSMEVYNEGKLITDILYSGKLGLALTLTKNMSCVVTMNVNDLNSLISLSAELSIEL